MTEKWIKNLQNQSESAFIEAQESIGRATKPDLLWKPMMPSELPCHPYRI